MRKLLLATVAAMGASMGVASVADAQTATPAPGTVTVRLNGRVRFYAAYIEDRDADNSFAVAGSTSKQANYTFGEYGRLYPGFDGLAANGLKYGASLEIRQDQSSGAGGGSFGSISQANRARSALYFRRIWGYMGTDKLGTIRLGAVDSASSTYMTGNFENFNDGGLNGDVPGLFSQSTIITWPFADVGNLYTTSKAVYLSPQFFGFDFGVSYEPNSGNVSIQSSCGGGSFVGSSFISAGSSGNSGPGCDRLSSSASNVESARRRNTFDGLVRYRGTFGPVGVAATAGYINSGHVLDNSGIAFTSNPLAATGARQKL